ncbi:MurR/RpiR family transcriptional regulator [Pseudomonas sp. TTU2014-080ASC]|uniref:MurR/RpiR family transcriptional regulator n=1 Tax=Pseudomonas sp. TTU2014-080ASC TaxID=1729724 RepID=UPI0007184EA7|nr:MurR/RpiR family transcriptional regulator [Pseudomonas sp. TTU2014-080ASC]KRW61508.1 RpiR family transcriptional regulator [Pseudomonas sp. TTU2014-080ASC]
MNLSLKQRLEKSLTSRTASSRAIATYMLANLNELAFSNAAEVAAKVGVSESTVGRFCRALGYPHLKALKEDLRDDLGDSPWLIGDRLKAFRRSTADETRGSGLEREIAALVRVHEHQHSAQWKGIVQRLAQRPKVFAAGFQTERGIASSFVHLLQYLRDGVQLVDGAAGHYADVLLSAPEQTALVVFEARRYSRHALELCQQAQARGIAVTLITDDYCDWAEQHADEVLRVPTDFNLFWESAAAMLSLVHLLINDVFRLLGPEVDQRLESVARLHNAFVGYTSSLKENN